MVSLVLASQFLLRDCFLLPPAYISSRSDPNPQAGFLHAAITFLLILSYHARATTNHLSCFVDVVTDAVVFKSTSANLWVKREQKSLPYFCSVRAQRFIYIRNKENGGLPVAWAGGRA